MINEKVFEEMALMVTRQTELSLEEAKDKLKENKYDYISVIKNEMGIEKKIDKDSGTINQKIYKEIRTLLDDGCKSYRANQEYKKKKEEYIEKIQKQINAIKNKKLENIEEKDEPEIEEDK
tara:strand:+ start:130 stop:492 length:363 start_codon:yes stop_codon:yes gene_type:complete